MKKRIVKILSIIFIIMLVPIDYKVVFATVNNELQQGVSDSSVIYESTMTREEYYRDKENEEITIETIENAQIITPESEYREITRQASINDTTSEKIKLAIYQGLTNINSSIDLSLYCTEVNYQDYQNIYDLYFGVLAEKSEIFYTPLGISMSYAYNQSTGKLTKCTLSLKYEYEKNEILNMKEKLNLKVNLIKERYLNGIDDELKKEYIIYDYILNNTSYDYDNYLNNTIPDISHTSYGALINGQAVCDGYSKAAKLLFNEVGIESGIITSSTMNHAWNYVKINGQYYNLDITWDDPVPEGNKIRYKYFNLSNKKMAEDHTWVLEKYPICNGEAFAFLREHQMCRINDKLYLRDNTKDSIDSTNLVGENKVSVLQAMGNGHGELVAYNNILNFDDDNVIKSYNTKNGLIDTTYKYSGYLYSLYLKDTTLFIKTSNGIENIDLNISKDFNYDSVVDIVDLAMVAIEYNSTIDKPGINKLLDLNKDGIIDIFDIVQIAKSIN
ncbi:transglutaminase domain-containing protein [Clostridium gasigenes]|uniref:transglutaminase domain-containing protein n=1 Tax=Clostridium gasigenes TaxID=94869 RepID=UPI000B801D96|nr:transglutaminase domain-containing protein [Clostridium gasigenes]